MNNEDRKTLSKREKVLIVLGCTGVAVGVAGVCLGVKGGKEIKQLRLDRISDRLEIDNCKSQICELKEDNNIIKKGFNALVEEVIDIKNTIVKTNILSSAEQNSDYKISRNKTKLMKSVSDIASSDPVMREIERQTADGFAKKVTKGLNTREGIGIVEEWIKKDIETID